MKRLAGLVALVLLACGPAATPRTSGAGAQSPTYTSRPTTASSGRIDEPSPAATPLPPPTRVDFSCRLPVELASSDSFLHPAFVDFPSAVLVPQPVISDVPATGPHGVFYDRPSNKWIPAPRQNVSPDGRKFAWAGGIPGSAILHIVDVSTSHDASTELKQIQAYMVVLDFDGLFAHVSSGPTEGPPSGIWRYDTASGAVTEITDRFFVVAVDSARGAAWFSGINPDDRRPPQGMFATGSDEIVRMNLATGSFSTWLYTPGMMLRYMGLDPNGNPIVVMGGATYRNAPTGYAVVLAPNDVHSFQSPAVLYFAATGVDTHGVWLIGDGGLYLYRQSQGAVRVSDQPITGVAGDCV